MLSSTGGALLVALALQAGPPIGNWTTKYTKEPRINSLCGYVDNQLPTGEGSPYKFMYQEIIHGAAGILVGDSKEVWRQKIQKAWSKSLQNLNCSSPGFSVIEGSLVKYAVSKYFTSFIYDAACNWQVDLNHIDHTDGDTALDYVKRKLTRAEEPPRSPTAGHLKTYYTLMRKAGARHASELRSGMPPPVPGPCK